MSALDELADGGPALWPKDLRTAVPPKRKIVPATRTNTTVETVERPLLPLMIYALSGLGRQLPALVDPLTFDEAYHGTDGLST